MEEEKLFRINTPLKKKEDLNFTINEERVIPLPFRHSGMLKNITETRPKQCPYCLTNDSSNIERLKDLGKWRCKKCTYQWG